MTEKQAASLLLDLNNVLILTHRRPDGDTIGCAAALCLALRSKGKTAWVMPNEDAHSLFDPYFEGVLAPASFVPEHIVAVDTASVGMLTDSAACWQDRIELCIDHHASNTQYAADTCLDGNAAACGEVLYRVLCEMNVAIDSRMAMLLYMAIATDTGCFVYSNTTPETHMIAADLLRIGFDAAWVNKRHFRVKSRIRLQVESRLVQTMDIRQNGTLVFATIPLSMMDELHATERDLEDISAFIGQVEGVVNAVTIREQTGGKCKISIRTDGITLNASDVCAVLGGGGHSAAAGATFTATPDEAKELVYQAIEKVQNG